MKILKKLFIPKGEKEVIDAVETWKVTWNGRIGRYASDITDEAEFFLSKEDAEKFALQLREAFSLLRIRSENRVVVIKNT